MEPNVPLLRKVWEHVKERPADYRQEKWVSLAEGSCGSAYCFAGHALLMSGHELRLQDRWTTGMILDGKPTDGYGVANAAAKELGLPFTVADEIFRGYNSLDTIKVLVENIIGEELL